MSTKQHEVVESGLSTIGPVRDVMAIDEAGIYTTRKTTAVVSSLQCAADRRWNRARFAPDIERFAVLGLTNAYNTTIADNPSYGLGCEHRTILDLRRIVRVDGAVLRQRFRGSVPSHDVHPAV